ncbi:P-loop containing nucleoside triphosphate hydrolase protein [Chaetomium tenue]|uniref:P-loop containing nucleoside triphosphate hydrolase protein n=1 Tax=Chaetomium tenue TaxID=1854479 RepID=A0ACB7NY34_9PEZI|nr:P-loop containing nucleoside triphosphate hydrolase protein [Chaetomium globosum]
MTAPEDDSTRQETPNQPLDATADRPSEDTQAPNNDSHKPPGDDVVDSKPGAGSPDPDDSVLDSCTSESSSPGSSTDDAASETSESGLSEDDHDTKTPGSKTSNTHTDKKPDTATDDGPEPDKESDDTVIEDDNVPSADEPPELVEAEIDNEAENANASVTDDTATVDDAPEADNEAPIEKTPEPSEAGDAAEADSDADADGDAAANKTPDASEAGDAQADSEPYEDSDVTKRLRRMKDKSPSRMEWILRKEKFGKDNEALDELMLKFGLEEVKAHFLWVYDERQRARGRDDELWDLTNLHTCFLEGGENTRTMVLNLYIKLLQSLGLVEADLVARGKSGDYLGDTWEAATQHGNKGIFIVDTPEAEIFSPLKDTLARRFKKSNAPRPPVVLFHIPHSADNATDYILEPSGDVPSMHTIPVRQTEDDLLKTLKKEFNKELSHREAEGGWDGPIAQKFVRRAMKNGDLRTPNAVRESVDGLKERRRKRVEAEKAGRAPTPASTAYYIKSDFLGVTAAELGYQSTTLAELEKMIGMEDVKESVRELLAEASLSFRLELEGEPAQGAWSNRRCFIGPPGTGKTTAARLYGKILKEVGLLENDTVVEKRASDLIGPYIGHSEEFTQKAFKEARGGVLIIDDFHLLFPQTMHNTDGSDVFRAAVIDTIVAEIDPNTTRKEAIILIGYPDAMAEAFETSNPGLARRFPLAQAFRFHPYTADQLTQILHLRLTTHNLTPTPTALRVAEETLSLARHRPNFGNGGAIDTLLHTAQLARNARVAHLPVDADLDLTLHPTDFDPDWERAASATRRCTALFSSLQGMGGVMGQFQGYQALTARLRARGLDPRPHVPWALVFRGPPGTGKTTVARMVAQVYYDMGFLAGPEVVECSVGELLSPYTGGSGKKVVRMFERGLGKVLFVDEAYRLAEARAEDAIGEMVDCMTKERFCRKLVVVLAGYKEEMDELMRWNRGLRSRFATNVDFRPMKAADALQLLQTHLAKVDIVLGGVARASKDTILDLLTKLSKCRSWANGRDVIALSRIIVQEAYTKGKGHTETDDKGEQGPEKVVFQADDLISVLRQKLRNVREEDEETKAAESKR